MSALDLTPAQMLMEHEVADLRKEMKSNFEYLKDSINSVLDVVRDVRTEAKNTNGKVAALIEWRLRLEGGAIVVKGIWGAIGVYVIAATIGLFYMWVSFQQMAAKLDNIDITIRNTVRAEMQGLTLEEVK